MKAFQLDDAKVFELLRLSTIVDVKQEESKFFVRRRALETNPDSTLATFFGFDIEKIKELNKRQFEVFMQYKNKFEKIVLDSFPCIVTTIACAFTQQVVRRRFKRIVIDEATMVKEHEAFLSTLHAEQIVLIGDQK